ncbi:hypothetical protein [Paenibacillus contaminans]|uniref:Rad50/SbcC-type AAA domain-containing protein n=1 Tax=Paenibacillus contaminans TaxID=450362 RepID=A0A329LNC2_9BACL|nr:hypothetical protein [Paenibacillus contaminans]RAV08720.1 hypothetical protein DQG23_40615 [Paenibacillus contaminans]
MDIKINNLVIRCRKDVFNIEFSKVITYFYGKMGAGKSTVLHLIDFCLGNELVETPALQQEFSGADLHLTISGNVVELSRNKGSNQVEVIWFSDEGEALNVIAPTKATSDAPPLLPDTRVQHLSDLIFYISGIEPPRVRKSKLKEDTELIRLSYRDIMWYCYLDQDEIDSSFFNLGKEEHDYKRLKSRDVMRLILGFHQEQVALLETQLYETRQRKSTLLETAIQIEKFLKENNIGNTEEIEKELELLKNMITLKKEEALQFKETFRISNGHILDEYKSSALDQSKNIAEFSTLVFDLKEQISRRKKLQNEYAIAAVKVSRSNIAKEILKGAQFCNCPQCGQEIQQQVAPESTCSLCLQPFNSSGNIEEVEMLKTDLKIRQSELKESILKLERQLSVVEKERLSLLNSKTGLDSKIYELEMEYDSAFLAKARELERQIGEYEGRSKELLNLLPLPKKIEKIFLDVADLAKEEEKIKNELAIARRNAELDATNLEELKGLFIENLTIVGFPGINSNDHIEINTTDFIPRITRIGEDEIFTTEFANLGSGGKKTIFKCCFILAIHRLVAKKNIQFPSFLMLDTPMKNISERENQDIFEGFYNLIYYLYSSELSSKQLIIVDKEFFDPKDSDFKEFYKDRDHLKVKHMTPDDPNNPPLIQYYRGH